MAKAKGAANNVQRANIQSLEARPICYLWRRKVESGEGQGGGQQRAEGQNPEPGGQAQHVHQSATQKMRRCRSEVEFTIVCMKKNTVLADSFSEGIYFH